MSGERLARWPPALDKLHHRGARGLLGGQLVFGSTCCEIFELKLHLLEQPDLAFRAAAIELAPELLDLQLQPRDQRLGVRYERLCACGPDRRNLYKVIW